MDLLLLLILIAVGGLPLLVWAGVVTLLVAVLPYIFMLVLMFVGALVTGSTSMSYSDLKVFLGLIFLALVCSGLFWLDRERVKRLKARAIAGSPPIQSARQQSLPRWAQAPSAKTACK